jgi:hypothetical protein
VLNVTGWQLLEIRWRDGAPELLKGHRHAV